MEEFTFINGWKKLIKALDQDSIVYVIQVSTGDTLKSYANEVIDTDSAIFIQGPGDDEIPTGSFLGDLTDEVLDMTNDPGAYIDKVAILGPKCYQLRIRKSDGTHVYKSTVKGIQMNHEASKALSAEKVFGMAKTYETKRQKDTATVPQYKIVATPFTHTLTTVRREHKIEVTTGKRFKPPGKAGEWLPSLPYGYVYNTIYSDTLLSRRQFCAARYGRGYQVDEEKEAGLLPTMAFSTAHDEYERGYFYIE